MSLVWIGQRWCEVGREESELVMGTEGVGDGLLGRGQP